MSPKKTPFFNAHVRAGGRMVDFGGWSMPIQYAGVLEEHHTVRRHVGLFDVSHMGEVEVSGPDTKEFCQRLITNDFSRCGIGKAQYTAMCKPDGGIVDDLIGYRLEEQHVLFVVNASNTDKDFTWMQKVASDFEVCLENRSAAYAQLALQGPKADETLAQLTDVDLSTIPFFGFARGQVAGASTLIARTGYTGERGFELYFEPSHADIVWTALLEAGQPHNIRPIGLGARDTLRLEMKFALYGNDIDESTNPLEAGLGWVVKLRKGDFVGREALIDKKRAGLTRRLVGFELIERGIPRAGYSILSEAGEVISKVASGGMAPSLSKPIGTAYLPIGLAKPGSRFKVEIRKRCVPAVVVKTPFYEPGSAT